MPGLLRALWADQTGVSWWPARSTLWDPAYTPDSADVVDPGSVNLGTRFRSSSAGFILGVRFYRGANNTQPTHNVALWTAGGVSLASADTVSETSSGWQEALFAAPVVLAADTEYTVSYFVTNHYVASAFYFGTERTVWPLTAPSGAGRYGYGAGPTWPVDAYHDTSYLVDPVFGFTVSVGAQVSAPWNTILGVVPVGAQVSAPWNTAATTSVTRQELWNTTIAATASRQELWNAAVTLSASRQAVWNAAGTVGASRQELWTVSVTVGVNDGQLWSTLRAAGSMDGLSWNGQALAQRQAGVPWITLVVVDAHLYPGADIYPGSVDLGLPPAARSLAWGVVTTSGAERGLVWLSAAAVGTTEGLSWSAYRLADGSVALRWDGITTVGQTQACPWADGQLVGGNADALWSAIALAVADSTLDWQLRLLVTDDEGVSWSVLHGLNDDLALRWASYRWHHNPEPRQMVAVDMTSAMTEIVRTMVATGQDGGY